MRTTALRQKQPRRRPLSSRPDQSFGKTGPSPDDGDASVRRCIVAGEQRPREGLIRFVVGPDGEIVPDLAEKLPGRGIWLSANRGDVETAVKKKLFSRAARCSVNVPEGLADHIEGLLIRRCTDLISLARRAGRAVTGFEKSLAEAKAGRAVMLLEAADGAADGREKMARAARGSAPKSDGTGARQALVFDCLLAEELGSAFGRERAVHAVISLPKQGGRDKLVEELNIQAGRLRGFRSGAGDLEISSSECIHSPVSASVGAGSAM